MMRDAEGALSPVAEARSGGEVVCSVIIPTYNRSEWLPACVESVRQSGVQHLEIIIVDDGSTDNTRDVVARLGEDIRYLHQANAGEAGARNLGLRNSCGRYVAFLDSDDRWLPGGHQRLIELMDDEPDVAVGFGDGQVGNARDGYRGWVELMGHETFWSLPHRESAKGLRVFERRPFFRRLAAKCLPIVVDAVIVRRSTLEQAGGFDEALRHAEDWELWLRLAAQHTFAFYDRLLAVYEKHTGTLTTDQDAMEAAFVRVLSNITSKDLPLASADRAWVKALLWQQMYGWVYKAFDRGDHAATRGRCTSWVRICGFHPRAAFYWGCSWLRPAHVRRLRALKWRLESACVERLRAAVLATRGG